MSTTTLFVSGTHCKACKHLIEDILLEADGVERVTVSLTEKTVLLETNIGDTPDALVAHLTPYLEEHGYGLHVEKPVRAKSTRDWLWGGTAALVAVVGYVALERAGLTSLIGGSETTLATAFVVGLVASVSTCLAVVGGLVLSVSATYAHEKGGVRPQVLFHAGRLAGFFVLGGLLGALGEVLHIGIYGSALLGVAVSIVMLVLGVHLLDITTKVRAFTLPRGVSTFFTTAAHRAGAFAPVLLGAVTFFLPCGFTQSMQVVALSTGSFVSGALTMLVFALGTLPVLALLSFGSFDLAKTRFRGTFFKAAGILVILFALFNLHNALVLFGVIPPLLSF